MDMRIYSPFTFQGNLKNKTYFEGWYYKHSSADQQYTWCFIPGVSLNEKDSHSFIQVMNGITGSSEYIRYPLNEFRFDKAKRRLMIEKSTFSEDFIELDIKTAYSEIRGRINYLNRIPYPRYLFSPGIMGWYSFVPFMECNHGIVSVNHDLTGILSMYGKSINFDNGNGYIEKDWGKSFPEAWIWLQSNNFSSDKTSFFFSIAKIPWIRNFFIGFICFLYHDNKFYTFSTYNGSKVKNALSDNDRIHLTVENKKYTLHISAIRKGGGELKAPSMGEMSRKIKESINSEVSLRLTESNGNLIFNDTGHSAGVEIIDKVFEYL